MNVGARKALFCLFCLIGLMASVGSVSAETIYVNGSNPGAEDGTTWATGWKTIQKGINNATAGDTVTVSAGTYTENVDVNVSVNLIGNGSSLTIVNASDVNDHVFNLTNVNSVNISGFTVKDVNASWPLGLAGIYLSNSNYSKIEGVNASNNRNGILLSYSNNNTIANNTANSNSDDGILLYSSSNNTVTNNTAVSNTWEGIHLHSSSNNTITGNNASNTKYGIWLRTSSNYNKIEDNSVCGNSQFGIYSNFSSSYNIIANNTANSNNNDGIHLESSNSNTLSNNTADSNSNCGIRFISSNSSVIENNNASNNLGVGGIYLGESSVNNTLTNNNFSYNRNGITLLAPGDNNTIADNTACNNTDYGLQAGSFSNGVITGNTFNANGIYGVYLGSSSNNNIISNNNVSSNAASGIYLLSSNNNTIEDNTAWNNTANGVYLSSSSNNTLTNNTLTNNYDGIYLGTSHNNTITNSTANSNAGNGISITDSENNTIVSSNASSNTCGIYLENSDYNSIYNNYFNNTENFAFSGGSNYWNTTKQASTNIAGGSNIGGNLWAYPNGTGFSETCASSTEGICGSSYTLASGNVDYLPLAKVAQSYPVHNLDSGINYTTIQGALDAASSGDTIEIITGNYTENLDITKAVNLVGAGKYLTVVNASNPSDHVIDVSGVDGVNISGLTVTGTGITSGKAGVQLENSDYSKIENVYSLDNPIGINLSNCDNTAISNNTFYKSTEDDESNYTVYGLKLYNSDSNTISNNTVSIKSGLGPALNTVYYYGFSLQYSGSNILSNNNATNFDYGFTIEEYSHYNTLSNNNYLGKSSPIPPDVYGFTVNLSNFNTLINNTAFTFGSIFCGSPDYYGVYLDDASNNTISGGTFYDSGYGIYLGHEDLTPFHPKNNSIVGNEIFDSCHGIYLSNSQSAINTSTTVANNTVYQIDGFGIAITSKFDMSTIENNTVYGNDYGIYMLETSYHHIITKNTVRNNSQAGVRLSSSSPVDSNTSIYDNFFNNSKNTLFQNSVDTHYWNITKTAGTNIAGGSWIGGNYWAYPNGTGFSQSCDDADYDGLCDSSYTVESGNIDYLPLAGIPTLVVTIIAPGNTTYNSTSITFNVTTSLSANITYSLNGAANVSLYNESTQGNKTIVASEGPNNIIAYANDTFGNSETSTVYFTVDTTPPKFSLISSNNSQAGLSTLFSVYWTDNSGLSGYIFSTNNTGTWVNESYSFTGTGNWSNVTKTLNRTAGLDVGWQIYTNDSVGNCNVTPIQVISTADTTPPQYSLISSNNSQVGLGTLFSVYWTDNSGLSGYIFSTNNTGTWTNDSYAAVTGTGNWSNITKTLNTTAGLHVGWRIYANDTSDQWNLTPVQVILTTPAETPPPPPGGGGGGGAAPPKNLATATVKLVEAGKMTVFAFDEELSEFVSEINLVAKQNAYNVMISLQPMTEKPYASMASPKGLVYRYLKVSTAFSDTRIDSANIKFKIKVSWLKEEDIDPLTVTFNRNYNSKWQVLTTTKTGSDDVYVYYTAETPGFSYFSITAEEGSGYPEEAVPEETPAPTATPAPTPEPEVAEEGPSPWAMISPKMFEEAPVETETPVEAEAGKEEGGGFPIFKVFTSIILLTGLGAGGYLLKKRKPLQKKES